MRPIDSRDQAIADELEKILASPSFVNSPQLSRFLRFVVEQARAGNGGQLKEYLLGVEVLHKDQSFDPRIDTGVRTEARRLRHKLAEYYHNEGSGDGIEIELPKGSYCPVFHTRAIAVEHQEATPARAPRRRMAVAGLAAALVIAAGTEWWLYARRGKASAPSIAILPLENLSGDAEQEYFSDGMTDALITDLARIDGLRVISRTSVLHYKRSKQTVPEIARQLNVQYVLEGTVARSADRVRVTAQLIAAPADRHVWAESYERPRGDVLALQSELARDIARHVNARITPQEHARLNPRAAVDSQALDAYLQGRFNWHTRDEARIRLSIDYFRRAIARQPDYALAYAGLADAYSVLAGRSDGALRAQMEDQSCAAARKAVELDDYLGEAHASLGGCADTWNWSERESEFRKAVDLSPGNSTAHQWYAGLLTKIGRPQDGIAQARLAVQLDPLSPAPKTALGWTLYMARQYPAAAEQSRQAIEVFPSYGQAYANLGIAYAAAGRYADAADVLEKGIRLAGSAPALFALLAHVRALAGDSKYARELIEKWKSRQVTPIAMALLYTDIGDKDHAITWLERGVEQRSMYIDELKVEPMFDQLHSDPRFTALLRKMNLSN